MVRVRSKVQKTLHASRMRAYYHTNVANSICVDCRRFDKRRGRANDLTVEFVSKSIADGCLYCGETSIRMSLDRIDK